jgi:hypothetical protein
VNGAANCKELMMDIRVLADLLREAEEHHGKYEPTAPKHHWWDWYAAYVDARERGDAPEQASTVAGLYMDGLLTKRFRTDDRNVEEEGSSQLGAPDHVEDLSAASQQALRA